MIGTIAGHQITYLRRQRIFTALLTTLLVMTALAGILGWSSQNTIGRVYEEAVKLLESRGQQAPPNPVGLRPTLAMLSNMAIYIPLIGALLALVLGHLSLVEDQSSGVARLLFTRQISRTQYLLGRLAGAAAILAAVVLACLVVSWYSVSWVNADLPTPEEFWRLALFYLVSWLYLMLFAVIGMTSVLLTSRRSLALMSALGIWLVVTFVVPQFTSALQPTASLHPISAPVSTSQAFFDATAKARPLSVSEQYKTASAQILATAPGEGTARTASRILPIVALTFGLIACCTALVRRHDYSRSGGDD